MMRRFTLSFAAVGIALLLGACSRSPRVSFYTLDQGAAVQAAPPLQGAAAVVVGPVTLPELVDRPQLVVRVNPNRVEILESQRWAEPLKAQIPRVIAGDLARLLGSDRVASYQQYAGTLADYRVLLDILRFEATPGESVTVETNWTVKGGADGSPRRGHSLKQERVGAAGYDALAAAFGRALAGVSGDIAAELRAEKGIKAP